MSIKPHGLEPIPEETRRLVQRLIPKGTLVTQLRDALGPIDSDEPFAPLSATGGRPAEAPWRLALVTVLQAIEGLTDRQAAEAVRTRIDWLYALALPLDDPGFDYSMLSDFRQRVLAGQAQDPILEPIVQVCRQRGWLKARGKQRTDATAVLARVRARSHLESVGESMRAALNALAEQEPAWVQAHWNPEWVERSVHRFELARFPKAETQRQLLREQVGQDVGQLLACIDAAQTPEAVRSEPCVTLLRQVFAQHDEQQGETIRWRAGAAVSNEQRIVSPSDPEARRSRKRDLVWVGYQVHLRETCDQNPTCPHLITPVAPTVATLQDTQLLAPIQEQVRAKELAPAEHYVDQGYPSGAYGAAGAPHRATHPGLCPAVRLACWRRGDHLASGAHPAPAAHALPWAAQNASASCRHCRWSQSQAHRESSACSVPRPTQPSCASEITSRSLARQGGLLMVSHLDTLSQQSHSSAPTDIQIHLLKAIKRISDTNGNYFRCCNQFAIACPTSSGESSWG
jgi:transposase